MSLAAPVTKATIGFPAPVAGVTYTWDAWTPAYTVTWESAVSLGGGGSSIDSIGHRQVIDGIPANQPGPFPAPDPGAAWSAAWAGATDINAFYTPFIENPEAQASYSQSFGTDVTHGSPGFKSSSETCLANMTKFVFEVDQGLNALLGDLNTGVGVADGGLLQEMYNQLHSGIPLDYVIEWDAADDFATTSNLVFEDQGIANVAAYILNITGSSWYTHNSDGNFTPPPGWMTPSSCSAYSPGPYTYDLLATNLGSFGELGFAFVTPAQYAGTVLTGAQVAALTLSIPTTFHVPSFRQGFPPVVPPPPRRSVTPSLRQIARDDGQGAMNVRQIGGNAPTSMQRSTRQAWRNTYL